MRRIARWLGTALAALASVSPAAQVLTGPLGALPGVRLTDSCATEDTGGVEIDGSPALVQQIADIANDPGADPAVLRSLWLPKSAGSPLQITGHGFVVLAYDPFQDTLQIADDIKTAWASRGVTGTGQDSYLCFDPSPPPPIYTVSEFTHPHFGEYRLAVGSAEAASLSADGWVPTGETYRVLGEGNCYGGSKVFRFIRTQAAWRGSTLLTMDAAECGNIRKSNPSWRPLDVPFFSVPPVGGACTGQYSGIAVYRVALPRAPMGASIYRFTSSQATYNDMLDHGWTGRGIAFCAMP